MQVPWTKRQPWGEFWRVLEPHLVDVTVGPWGARSGHSQVGMSVPTAVPTPPPFLPSHVLCSWAVTSLHAQICVRCVLSVKPSSAPPELLLEAGYHPGHWWNRDGDLS